MKRLATLAARLWQPLEFLRGNYRLVIFWPLAGIVVAALAWAILLQRLDAERKVADREALRVVSENAAAQSRRIGRNLVMIDQMLAVVKMHWQMLDGAVQLSGLKTLEPFPGSRFDIFILDRSGRVILTSSSHGNVETNQDYSNRPCFVEQKNADHELFFVGFPLASPGGKLSINYSRRLLAKDGTFAGVAAINIDANALITDYDESILGRRGLVQVIGDDNISRSARVGNKTVANAVAPEQVPLLERIPASAKFLEGNFFTDARNRYLAWASIDGYPLNVMVGLDQQDYLSIYFERRSASVNTALSATMALAAFVLVAIILSIGLVRKNYQLQHAHTTYRIATEGGDDGFYILLVVKDAAQQVADFRVIDCNERGAAIFCAEREKFIGATLFSWSAFMATDALTAILTQAVSHGKATGELEVDSAARTGTLRYLHLKAVRSGANLAVTLQDVTYQRENIKMLERSSNEDMLTGLPNRAWVHRFLRDLLHEAHQASETFALLFIDLDGFKQVNDSLGHAAGDEALIHAGQRIQSAIRPADHLARLGGDEFIVILRKIDGAADAQHVSQRIIAAFGHEFSVSQGSFSLGTSIGISLFPNDADDADTLLKNADIAMYDVKTKGKNNFSFFDARIYSAILQRKTRELELQRAIAEDEFVMVYQARLDVLTGRMTSLEALLRWQHPTAGIVGPDQFIPLAEETGMIVALGELVIGKVCQQVKLWQVQDDTIVPVSINVSSRQFNEVDVPTILRAAIDKHQIASASIEIELTESTMIEQPAGTRRAIAALQAMGVKILIDDFGTGYSSLSMLHALHFDVLKVDKSLTSLLGPDEQNNLFFSAIITMAHALGLRVVAEGVEKEEQLAILKRLQCDEVQGFYFGVPVRAPTAQSAIYTQFPGPDQARAGLRLH